MILVSASLLLAGTSCVSKKKYLEAENGRIEAEKEAKYLRERLIGCQDESDRLVNQVAALAKDTALLRRDIRNYKTMLNTNMGEQDKLNALLSEKMKELDEREQTINQLQEMIDEQAWLHERASLPLIADEFLQRLPDVRRAYGLYDGINIKLMKSTGMREAYQMAILARALDMKVMVGCMTETSCAVSAAAQLSPMVDWADLDGNLLISNDLFDGMKIVDGMISLPDRPGIGVVPL